jgi:hypothetical protein
MRWALFAFLLWLAGLLFGLIPDGDGAERTLIAAAGAGAAPRAIKPTSCTICHSDPEWITYEPWVEMVEEYHRVDVHHAVGLSCHDCHGGNPDPALAEEMFEAKDETFEPRPFLGAPSRFDIPQFCGDCHSNPEYMRHFRPDARVDQLAQYWTSHHGQSLRKGDSKVATCVDCHPAHTTRRPTDPNSWVHPTQVAETCRRCHSDSEYMDGYTLATGHPLPVNQYERWRQSAHGRALLERDDLAAPTCNDCHGDHGIAPPGIPSVNLVCGQCHGRQADLFRDSVKLSGFRQHNEIFMADSGMASCAECHEPPEPSARITHIHQFTECGSCHGNHAVLSPGITMLGPVLQTPCAYCHEGHARVLQFHEPARVQRSYEETLQTLLAEAAEAGLTGDARFDWLVDRAIKSEHHLMMTSAGPQSRPEFERLFKRFRIGKTHFTYTDAATGQEVSEPVLRCVDCHAEGSPGFEVSRTMHDQLHELAVMTARANRLLLAARRGGVEVRQHESLIDAAVNSHIEMQVLVHSFATGNETEFETLRQAGLENAQSALAAGANALDELRFRRVGLFVFLGIVLLVLIGLGLKIRELSQEEPRA